MTSPRALSLKGLLGRLTCLYLSCFVVFTYFNSQLHASFDLGELGNSDRTTGSFFFFWCLKQLTAIYCNIIPAISSGLYWPSPFDLEEESMWVSLMNHCCSLWWCDHVHYGQTKHISEKLLKTQLIKNMDRINTSKVITHFRAMVIFSCCRLFWS